MCVTHVVRTHQQSIPKVTLLFLWACLVACRWRERAYFPCALFFFFFLSPHLIHFRVMSFKWAVFLSQTYFKTYRILYTWKHVWNKAALVLFGANSFNSICIKFVIALMCWNGVHFAAYTLCSSTYKVKKYLLSHSVQNTFWPLLQTDVWSP